ncbi:MAG: SNF2 helicase associated domain-containing protein [Verrucomicrobiota bacterium]|nr:SNF2 helicase associated domain-containing protein [Verrucomicrobiota bacterium]
MLNFRKLRQDFASNILKEGRSLFEKSRVVSAKIIKFDNETIRFSSKILGNYDNAYESEIEVDRFESQAVHTNCDCPSRYDCQHLAALIFFLEEKIDALLIEFSKESDISKSDQLDQEEKLELIEAIKEAETKEVVKQDARYQKQVLQEYVTASEVLSNSPFFFPTEESALATAELAVILNPTSFQQKGKVEFQLAMRLPFRSKPLQISQLKGFLEAVRYEEPLFVAGRRLFFSMKSFDEVAGSILQLLLDHARVQETVQNERAHRIASIDPEIFGQLLAKTHEGALRLAGPRGFKDLEEELPALPCLYLGSLETPLRYASAPLSLRFTLEYIEPPAAKLLLKPKLVLGEQCLNADDAVLFECAQPGLIHQDTYYRFPLHIKRTHLLNFNAIREMTIPEPLLGTFVENALPELKRFVEIEGEEILNKFVTLPFTGKLGARCQLSYLDGELEATLFFSYEGHEVSAIASKLSFEDMRTFVSPQGVLARNLVEERQIIEDLFQDFVFNPQMGIYVAKTEKKIVEFMTGTIPRNQHRVQFECPQNLLDQFIYDETKFQLALDVSDTVGYYGIDLKVDGSLKGIKLELLWECVSAKRSYVELDAGKARNKDSGPRFSKILVLDLDRIGKLVQLFDELGIKKLDDHKEQKPLWNLATIDPKAFDGLPVDFKMSKKLLEIRSQMLGETALAPAPIPKDLKADLRPYQKEGVHWLERLRLMYLNGILADDMGLGKTVQAIAAITQNQLKNKDSHSLIVCPTSLLYNWKEELNKFNPKLKAMVVDGIPNQRKKLLQKLNEYDVVITSYTLLQKDIEIYSQNPFSYAILDEAQHIKNRGTRNAKSVKMIQAAHRLILTGTPIENSLDELWSLMDFLMPGFLSTYDRFLEKYIRVQGQQHVQNIEYLRKKVSPFILRRMKSDVLHDLPPVAEIVYHCQLSDVQMELYRSYAASARDELVKLVERDGFDKVQIHVLATLTRLKQICCHPAIFAKEKAESGDSAKYEMLLELLQTLVESNHKTVIFSQYTRMLQIMREDFEQRGISFSYLDGSTKNRLDIVKEFNENKEIPVFLVSLKAGGTGLNLVGADTVIHYDMWWNPAVENQATDRVHRIGQKQSVSSYKLITLNTIEEKIVEMQRRKKGLVKKVVSCDDEAIAKLTWEDVLELLQT